LVLKLSREDNTRSFAMIGMSRIVAVYGATEMTDCENIRKSNSICAGKPDCLFRGALEKPSFSKVVLLAHAFVLAETIIGESLLRF
jgi:hypothetical protein